MIDEHLANVSLLLPMSGANNGTTFTDYSPSPKTITRYGDTKTVTAESKYYGSSGYFDGTGDYLTTPLPAIGEVDFTVEAWVYCTSASIYRVIVSFRAGEAASDAPVMYVHLNTGVAAWYSNGSFRIVGTKNIVNGWHHIAVCRASGYTKLFVDGTQEGNTFADSLDYVATSNSGIGRHNGITQDFIGYLQDVRYTLGVARYTEDFTPPSRLHPAVSGTVKDAADTFAARKVLTYREDTDALSGSATSDGTTGAFEIFVPPVKHRVVITGEPDRNDLIFAGVEPV